MKRMTLKEVAKIAGVAPSTISFVLNGKGKQMRISDEVAVKIRQVVETLGYEPHRMAVNLRTGQSKTLGLIVESISENFFACLAKAIEIEAEQKGYNVVYCSTENNAQKGISLIQMLDRQMVDGYLITPAPGMEHEIHKLVQQHKPVVLMDSYFPAFNVPYVLVNNFKGVQQGMEHFIGKGFTNIAFVTLDVKLIQLEERLRGYATTLKDHRIPVREKLISRLPLYRQRENNLKALQAFIENNPKIEAIFFATNYLGIMGLEVVNRLGWKMPQDLSVICFDDHDIFRLYPPGISVIEQPIDSIAKSAIDQLMQQLNKKHTLIKKAAVELPGRLILRGSA